MWLAEPGMRAPSRSPGCTPETSAARAAQRLPGGSLPSGWEADATLRLAGLLRLAHAHPTVRTPGSLGALCPDAFPRVSGVWPLGLQWFLKPAFPPASGLHASFPPATAP